MPLDVKTVTISEAVYKQLLRDSEFLDALQACGVDNWDGYEDAQDMMSDEDEDDEDENA